MGAEAVLAKVELFASLPHEDLLQLETVATRRHFAKGMLIFNEGEPVDHLLVLLEGRMRIFHNNDAGREFVYGVADAGVCFGELALFADEVRTVSAEAEEDCVFMALSRANFLQLLSQHPQLKDHMLITATNLIRHLTKTVSDLALKDVYGRIRKVFEALAVPTEDGGLIEDQLTQQDLADRVGASREMIAKVMKELVAGGYVQTGRRRILILKKLPEHF